MCEREGQYTELNYFYAEECVFNVCMNQIILNQTVLMQFFCRWHLNVLIKFLLFIILLVKCVS